MVSFESDDGLGLALEIIESGGSLEVFVVLSKPVGEAVTVNVVATDITAHRFVECILYINNQYLFI